MDVPTGQWHQVAAGILAEGGIRAVRAVTNLPPNDAMNTAIRITVNGASIAQLDCFAGQRPHGDDFGVAALYELREGDDVRVEVFQDSGQAVAFEPAHLTFAS